MKFPFSKIIDQILPLPQIENSILNIFKMFITAKFVFYFFEGY